MIVIPFTDNFCFLHLVSRLISFSPSLSCVLRLSRPPTFFLNEGQRLHSLIKVVCLQMPSLSLWLWWISLNSDWYNDSLSLCLDSSFIRNTHRKTGVRDTIFLLLLPCNESSKYPLGDNRNRYPLPISSVSLCVEGFVHSCVRKDMKEETGLELNLELEKKEREDIILLRLWSYC